MIERKFPQPGSEHPARLLILPLWILAIYSIGRLMSEASAIFLWIVCGFFLFVLLDPISEYLKARKWPATWSAAFLVVTFTVTAFVIAYILGALFSGMVTELEQSKKIFLHAFESLNTTWNSLSARISDLHADSANEARSSSLGSGMGGTILHGLGSAVTIFTFSLLVPVLAFFFLVERDGLARVLSLAYREKGTGTRTWQSIVKSTRSFFIGNLILGLITYPLFVIIFWIFSVPSIFTVAALAAVFNLVPFAGAILSGLLPSVALYAQTQAIGSAAGLYGCCVLIHFAMADFLTPKILGSKVNINATTSTIALIAWGELWGGVGLILAIPLMSLIKILFEHSSFFWLQWIAKLMSGDTEK